MNVIENINAVNSEKIKRWNRMETSEKLHEYKILKKIWSITKRNCQKYFCTSYNFTVMG